LTGGVLSEVPSARDPEAVYPIFGRRLRELRDEKHISQDELASFSGLTRSSIANIESGKQRVFLHQILQFAARLKVELKDLVRQEDFAFENVQEASNPRMAAFLEQVKSLAGEPDNELKEAAREESEPGEEG
jgi:transcriptional regulator with XRE-family HTH domain